MQYNIKKVIPFFVADGLPENIASIKKVAIVPKVYFMERFTGTMRIMITKTTIKVNYQMVCTQRKQKFHFVAVRMAQLRQK